MTSREHWDALQRVGTDLGYIAPADVLALLARIEALEGDRERLRSALRSLTTVRERPANRGRYVEHGTIEEETGFVAMHLVEEPCEVCAALRDTAP